MLILRILQFFAVVPKLRRMKRQKIRKWNPINVMNGLIVTVEILYGGDLQLAWGRVFEHLVNISHWLGQKDYKLTMGAS